MDAGRLDPVLMPVLANRFEAINREMTNTLLRSARSAVLNTARDFSCSILTGKNELLAAADGLPVHVFGSHLLGEAMCELHDDLRPGDAFLHNDPYLGNTHSADHTILVPVFVDGEHLFTTCAKAHQADIGNSEPTTYMFFARDVYEEGALNFPCVQIQRDYQDDEDLIRMCRKRIRVPDQWYGDYLAAVGSARIGERRLIELVERYGLETLEIFIAEWFDYSERRMAQALRQLPSGRITGEGAHDPFPGLPDGIPIKVMIDIDAEEGRAEIDLRDNIDCVPVGLNQSRACAMNNAMTGLFNCIDPDIPHNSGSFRRITVHLRENCVVGIPRFPASCSVATTNVADRLINISQRAFAQLGDGYGLAEGAIGQGPAAAVISGTDWRRGGAPYVNQLIAGGGGGGPGTPTTDGLASYGIPVVAGMMGSGGGSVEVNELKHPIHIRSSRPVPDSGGAGRFRGGLGHEVIYGPKRAPLVAIYLIDGNHYPPQGVRGGLPGQAARALKIDREGNEVPLPNVSSEQLLPGEWLVGIGCGGGGYGDPLDRDPELVLGDVLERRVTREKAESIYGVVFTGRAADESLAVDEAATARLRASVRSESP